MTMLSPCAPQLYQLGPSQDHSRTMICLDLLLSWVKLCNFTTGSIWSKRKHRYSLLPYPRGFKSSQNILIELLNINDGPSDFRDHARAIFGPCQGHVRHSFISRLARAAKFSRLSQFGFQDLVKIIFRDQSHWATEHNQTKTNHNPNPNPYLVSQLLLLQLYFQDSQSSDIFMIL